MKRGGVVRGSVAVLRAVGVAMLFGGGLAGAAAAPGWVLAAGAAAYGRGHLSLAAAAFRAGAGLGGGAPAAFGVGASLLRAGRAEDALPWLRRALETSDPGLLARVRQDLAAAHLRQAAGGGEVEISHLTAAVDEAMESLRLAPGRRRAAAILEAARTRLAAAGAVPFRRRGERVGRAVEGGGDPGRESVARDLSRPDLLLPALWLGEREAQRRYLKGRLSPGGRTTGEEGRRPW